MVGLQRRHVGQGGAVPATTVGPGRHQDFGRGSGVGTTRAARAAGAKTRRRQGPPLLRRLVVL
ncbi:hypothetical protein L573_1961, partial [Bordetella holmesii H620]